MNQLIMAIATGMYVGKIPFAPGTWGSLAAFVPWLLMRHLSIPSYLAILSAIFVIGFFVSGSAEKIIDSPDAGCIVIDEILGMLITLIAVPNHPGAWFLGFFLFRLFDVLKPFPIGWFDQHIHGGIGIMMDDVLAGIFALASLQLTWWLMHQ